MNKFLDFAKRLRPQDNVESVPASDPDSDVRPSDSQLLDYIYGLDPVTQLPCGDLSVYLGEKANPEIRQFIELNLLQERMDGKSAMDLPQEVINKFKGVISDDDISAFSRNHGESREEYADRLKLYFLNEKKCRAEEKRLKDLDKLIKND